MALTALNRIPTASIEEVIHTLENLDTSRHTVVELACMDLGTKQIEMPHDDGVRIIEVVSTI